MLSFEVTNSGRTIQITIDREGLVILQQKLTDLKTTGHVHLRGGRELNNVTPSGKEAIGEVIISTGGDDPVQ
jgi:hypothetical protein